MAVLKAVIELGEPGRALRREYAERITAAWHKSREKIFALGRALIDAKKALPHGEFEAMIDGDLPFGADHARRFMRIASDPRLTNGASKHLLPEAIEALDNLTKLNDQQYEHATFTGRIHADLTVVESKQIVRDYIHIDAKPPALHRPQAVARHAAPALPEGRGATTLSELIFLFISRRHALGLSQAAVDDKVGWAEGLCSKYEILHRDDGRAPSIEAILEYAQAMKCGLAVIPL